MQARVPPLCLWDGCGYYYSDFLLINGAGNKQL